MNKFITGPLAGCLAAFCILTSSCQKELDIDLDNPPPIPDDVADSTFLIKSIAWMYNDGMDSVVEHYAYDTVSRKISLSWTDSEMDPNDQTTPHEFKGAKTELSYNSAGLLVSVDYTHSPTLPPSDNEFKRMEIKYDEENIVEKITLTYRNGPADIREFAKRKHPDGSYQLGWVEPAIAPGDRVTVRETFFKPDGSVQLNYRTRILMGNSLEDRRTWVDSMAYDGNGNVEKVFTYEYDENGDLSEEYISVEYTGRELKGDQLYNHRKLVLRGISEIPLGAFDEMLFGSIGILSGYLEFEPTQFSKFPASRAKIRLYDGSYSEFQPAHSFDHMDRLIRFNSYFVDIDIIPAEIRIHYFK